MPRLLVLVIASRGQIYDRLINRYWKYQLELSHQMRDLDAYLVFGQTRLDGLDLDREDCLVYPECEENLVPGIFDKTVRALGDRGDSYDFTFRTNLSSFLDLGRLHRLVENCPTEGVYASATFDLYPGTIGRRVSHHRFIAFGSGCGFLLSRDLAKRLYERSRTVGRKRDRHPDDVVIGHLLGDVPQSRLKRMNVVLRSEFLGEGELKELVDGFLTNDHFHMRVKNLDREVDLQIFDYLVEHLIKPKLTR
jgi:hypothetical protein